MRALILAAGMGRRLALPDAPPKVLLRFGGHTLLARHLRILKHCGVERIDICVGYRAADIAAELRQLGAATGQLRAHYNSDFARGSIVSLWTLREPLTSGETVIFMDGDVLYDHRMLERLIAPGPPNCFLMDHNLDSGEDPVKLCLRDGRLVDIHKRPEKAHDSAGEWIGFARFTPEVAAAIATIAQSYVDAGRRDEMYELAFRDALFSAPANAFGVMDVTDLPWIEIDFADDLERARNDIFPRLAKLTGEPP